MQRRPRQNHLELARLVLDLAREWELRPGEKLAEQRLATACQVSRTPIRAALDLLENQSLVRRGPDGGFVLDADLSARVDVADALPAAEEEALATTILRDRSARRLARNVTTVELTRRYDVTRHAVQKAIKILTEESFLDRAPGQSWVFRALPDDPESRLDSLQFRLIVEPAAVLSSGFQLDGMAAAALRQAMEQNLRAPEGGLDPKENRKQDAAFHGLIAGGCGNRFIAEALTTHLRLSDAAASDGDPSFYRMKQATQDHLAILKALESQQFDSAADLIRVHLRHSFGARPQAANRGAPPLMALTRHLKP